MTPPPYIFYLLGVGVLVLLAVWLPLALKRLPLSLPIVSVALGAAIFGFGWLDLRPDPLAYPVVAERLTELVLIIALMGAGLKLDRPVGWRRWEVPWRLLAVAMPLTIAAVACASHYGLGFPIAAALLLAAALAPTDPVLASDIQVGPPGSGHGDETRFALTSEAGLNDGLAFPFVHLAITFAAASAASAQPLDAAQLGRWLLVDVLWRISAGIGVGWLAGLGLGWLTFGSEARLSGTRDGLMVIGATFVAYALAEIAHGYGFLAVFVSALTLRHRERNHRYHAALHEMAEQVERLLMGVVLILFGGWLSLGPLSRLTWQEVIVAMSILLVIRPLAGWVSLLGAAPRVHERALISFLGIRGIGSFYYLAYAHNHGAFGADGRIWAVVGLVVLASILMHGITSTPLMRKMDRLLPDRRGV
ncbi:cation:proton antiporter [Phenylobacterium sp. LjRoot219]|uniref:cation:proton antiporter n=1 Tax=Phenylobacterium sp. LjRoot219 TaxID=3342283 RepID=UPI003ED164CF